MKLVSAEKMRELDSLTIENYGIPGRILMENAGSGAAFRILEHAANLATGHVRRFVVLAGKGNNGGDAYVVARCLFEICEIPVVLYAASPVSELPDDAKSHAETALKSVAVDECADPPVFSRGDFIIDGLLGTGVRGAPRAPFDKWIAAVNSSGFPVVSLDIPSGLDGDTGETHGVAVRADLTVTMGLPKQGMVIGHGPELCGMVKCVDIGIPEECLSRVSNNVEMIFEQDIQCLGRKSSDSHKGLNGHLLVIGGSVLYSGAPFLSAEAALRSGAGLVSLALPQSVNVPRPKMNSIIVRRIRDGGKGFFSEESTDELNDLAAKADTVVIGPGIGSDESVRDMLRGLSIAKKPVLWDADGLNMLAETPWLLDRIPSAVLTPHPGEMKRLLNGFNLKDAGQSDRMACASALALKTKTVTVLKGHRTVTASPEGRVAVNSSGTPALATAGTGDVLAGMIGSFLAQGINPAEAAEAAVFIHGLASELGNYGTRGLTADDLVDLLPAAMMRISPFA
ncbi:MAG: NAD(P)H-hydrate dehydratase [Victivallales bacterium]|nr:NAD(P)H-hydrate dehydratase [Victivallales bacterium]